MKKAYLILLCVAVVGLLGLKKAVVRHFWKGETLSSSEVKKRWGNEPFDVGRFKSGNTAIRATMAYSLMKEKKDLFIGKPAIEIRELLGPNEGYYFTDIYPVYFIQEGKDHTEDTWQIVFLIDRNEKVAEIIVHKNCCDR